VGGPEISQVKAALLKRRLDQGRFWFVFDLDRPQVKSALAKGRIDQGLGVQ
jgi:hypothetical protein